MSASVAKRESQSPADVEQANSAVDKRTSDGDVLRFRVSILEPDILEKDGEKYLSYQLITEVRLIFLFKVCKLQSCNWTNHKLFVEHPTIVHRRYREFVWLRTQLKVHAKKVCQELPPLPPKGVLKGVTDQKFNAERLQGLDEFLQAICELKDLLDDESMDFLRFNRNDRPPNRRCQLFIIPAL